MSTNSQTRHLICSGRMILIKGHPRGQATNQMDEWGVGESTVSVGILRRIFDNCWEEWGRHLESRLFKALEHLLGIKKIRSSPYHPQSNEMIKEWHCPLKDALKAYNTEHWSDALPNIFLGFRAAFKEDVQSTSAELV
ncbi:integrase catalytic domain-containing protein [Trichonephila inaurata madagascariensis]|uniref:Integrase catalytic domain-containing protein n=1 Tax=Trichonephila inaurata madagascariensis TaxID=2747483 RepID=A0A8X6XN64_9ARAC|nr:integrase catalytic domain-containing protein [Trichonephila inaurata madagascariensis]